MIMRKLTSLLFVICLLLFVISPVSAKECGQLGAVDDLDKAAEMEDCAEEVMRPYGRGEQKPGGLCRLAGIPVIGDLFLKKMCNFSGDASDVKGYVVPQEAQGPTLSPPEQSSTSSANLESVEREDGKEGMRAKGLGSILNWLMEVIAGFTIKEEKGPHIPAGLPEAVEAVKDEGGEMGVMALVESDIPEGFDTLKRAYTPYALQEKGKPPGVSPPPELELTPTPLPSGASTPTPTPSAGLWYTIRYRDSSIDISAQKRTEIIEKVMGYWPNSKIRDQWDYVYGRAKASGWNPGFVIALWIEESGASGVHAWDVGCTGAPQDDLEKGLGCLFGLSYANKDFPEFLCIFSEGHHPCAFSINPNFPKNLKAWYDRVIPPGTDGAAEPL